MTDERNRPAPRRLPRVAAAVALFAAGALTTYLALRSPLRDGVEDRTASEPASAASPGETSSSARAPASPPNDRPAPAPLPDLVIPLDPALAERAGIRTAAASAVPVTTSVRLPGVVQPDAYRRVVVTPITGGRVTRVAAELGERMRAGEIMAEVYSPEVSEAHTRYRSTQAELAAHEERLSRTRRLVEIGAASQQELESLVAEHTRMTSELDAARSRLRLIGLNPERTTAAAASSIRIPAPISGVVIERAANVGAVVDPSTALFTVADTSRVWIVTDVYERDFVRVQVGRQATVTSAAYPGRSWQGRVTYVAPQVKAETRTAEARVELPNPEGLLRFGMFVDVAITDTDARSTVTVPAGAVQPLGSRHVVYLATPGQPGRFLQRQVVVGSRNGDRVEVLAGVTAGEIVVSEGAFYLRAEGERLGTTGRPPEPQSTGTDERPSFKVAVTDAGFTPERLTVTKGQPFRLVFTRTSEKTCATEVVIGAGSVKRPLPLNTPVAVDMPGRDAGEVTFTCGMAMLKGAVVVQ